MWSSEPVNDEHLLTFMRDMMLAGAETVNSSLEHAVFYIALHPGVQASAQDEIDSIIGPVRAPTYADKARFSPMYNDNYS